MTGLFLLARLAPPSWIGRDWLAAFAEAGVIGGLADWFAVTALFRRPLGLPIPHTAIIPRNKDRLGRALGDFIADNFLTSGVLSVRLHRLELSRRIAQWLIAPGHARILAARLVGAATGDSGGTRPRAESGLAAELIADVLQDRPLAPLAARGLRLLWRAPEAQRLLDELLAALPAWLEREEAQVADRLAGSVWRWAPKWLDRMFAQHIAAGLVHAAEGVEGSGHPWRAELAAAANALLNRLESDPDWVARGEVLKARWLNDPDLRGGLDHALGLAAGEGLEASLARLLSSLGRALNDDSGARRTLDRCLEVTARRLLSSRRRLIGDSVARVVADWDPDAASQRLEAQVGRDLQFIRVNGALAGGLAGLVLHGVSLLLR